MLFPELDMENETGYVSQQRCVYTLQKQYINGRHKERSDQHTLASQENTKQRR
jgi:hypothetical protein